jgi:ATP-grasp domain, R2K clade family 3
MKAYIQTDKSGNYFNVNAYVANDGFQTLGWETEKYFSVDDIQDNDPAHLVVGGIGNVRKRLVQLGIERTLGEIDYPEELRKYLGRKVWVSTIEDLLSDEAHWNVFIKPKTETKKFTGKVVRAYKDFIGLVDKDKPTEIWCSEMVHFKTEWRCFIRYGEILDIRQYKGAWDAQLDLSVIKNAVDDYTSAPAAYALDFGIDENNTMKLVEVNDGHSLGTYGLGATNYAKFLSARWAQLTNTRDYAYF